MPDECLGGAPRLSRTGLLGKPLVELGSAALEALEAVSLGELLCDK